VEKFKKIDELMEYDSRFDMFAGENIYHESLPKGLKLHHVYNKVKDINLLDNVHEDIQSQFNIAKNLFVYSWYCYPFSNVAELKAISTLEFALKMKINSETRSLRKLLNHAIENDYLIDSRLYEKEKQSKENNLILGIEPPNIDYKERTKLTVEFICKHRNTLAHGSNTLTMPSSRIFEITSDFINQLFKYKF
jgi:hypothetical protein